MSNENKDVFKFSIGKSVIAWPIVKSTEKAVLVLTPGGELWLPSWKFTSYRNKQVSLNSVKGLLRRLMESSQSASDSMIRVRRAGAGPTSKSHKFQVSVEATEYDDDNRTNVSVKRSRTFLLPLSQVRQVDGNWFAPRWLVEKKLDDKEMLADAEWPGMEAVRVQIDAAVESAYAQEMLLREAALAKARVQQEREEKIMREKAEQRERVNANGAIALAFCRSKYTIAELREAGVRVVSSYWPTWPPLERELNYLDGIIEFANQAPGFTAWREKNTDKFEKGLPKMPGPRPGRVPDKVLENTRVEWAEWLGKSGNKKKQEFSMDGCAVRIFGKKFEITLPDGRLIVKMAGPNLVIHDAEVEAT